MSDQPQEWTPDRIPACLNTTDVADWKIICEAHNAALAAERIARQDAARRTEKVMAQLVAERENLKTSEAVTNVCLCLLDVEREKHADTEADGVVFCGKCGHKL